MSGVAACGGAGRGYDHYTGALMCVPSDHLIGYLVQLMLLIKITVSKSHI